MLNRGTPNRGTSMTGDCLTWVVSRSTRHCQQHVRCVHATELVVRQAMVSDTRCAPEQLPTCRSRASGSLESLDSRSWPREGGARGNDGSGIPARRPIQVAAIASMTDHRLSGRVREHLTMPVNAYLMASRQQYASHPTDRVLADSKLLCERKKRQAIGSDALHVEGSHDTLDAIPAVR